MNHEEARAILEQVLCQLRRESHATLVPLIDAPEVTTQHTGAFGTTYSVEVAAVWDDQEGGAIRVIASVDDGGWRAYVPLSDDFIITPDGSFLDE